MYYVFRCRVLRRRRRSTSKGTAASSYSSCRIALENFCRFSHISVCLNFPCSTASSNRATVDGLTCNALLILYVEIPLLMSNIISSRLASMMRSVFVRSSPYNCFLVLVFVLANASNSRLSSSASFADESSLDETCGMRILYDISYSITSNCVDKFLYVLGAGIEPANLSAGDFKSPEFTNFSTRAMESL